MEDSDETADSYKISADLLISKRGDKSKIIGYLFKAASLYSEANRKKAIECLADLYNNLRGGTTEFEMNQYFRYMHQLARAYEDLEEKEKAADIYLQLAREFHRIKEKSLNEESELHLKNLKKFSVYLAKALILYDSAERYDLILKLARTYYKEFPELQKNKNLHGELFFCYEHIINAADITGSRYFREYYAELDRKLRESEFFAE